MPGRHTPPAASGKTMKISVHIRLPFRQKRRHRAGQRHHRRQFIQGLAQGLRMAVAATKRSGRITTSEALCWRTSYAGDLAYPPRVVRRRGFLCGMNLHFRHHLNEACAQRRHCWICSSLIPHSGLHPQPIPRSSRRSRYRVASRRRFPAYFRLNKHLADRRVLRFALTYSAPP